MSYIPTTWTAGDTVTSAKLNKLEQGVAAASSGGALVLQVVEVGDDVFRLDHTMGEIIDAMPLVFVESVSGNLHIYGGIASYYSYDVDGYEIEALNYSFFAQTLTDYPTTNGGK